MTPRLIVATPVRAAEMHAASVSLGYAEMLLKLHRLLPVEVLAGSLTFATDIVRGRNRIAAKILREIPDATHVLWLDDDQWAEEERDEGLGGVLDIAVQEDEKVPRRGLDAGGHRPARVVGHDGARLPPPAQR